MTEVWELSSLALLIITDGAGEPGRKLAFVTFAGDRPVANFLKADFLKFVCLAFATLQSDAT